MRGIEALDVVEGRGGDPGHRAARGVAVGVPWVEQGGQGLLAEIFVVVAPQGLADGVEGILLDAREVLDGKARGQDLIGEQAGERVEVIAVDRAGEDEGVLVPVDMDLGGHRVEGIEYLGPSPLDGAALAEHGGGELRQTFLAGLVVGGAGLEDQPEGDERACRRGQANQPDRALGGEGGRRGGNGGGKEHGQAPPENGERDRVGSLPALPAANHRGRVWRGRAQRGGGRVGGRCRVQS